MADEDEWFKKRRIKTVEVVEENINNPSDVRVKRLEGEDAERFMKDVDKARIIAKWEFKF